MNNRRLGLILRGAGLLLIHLSVLLFVVMATSVQAQASAQLSDSAIGRKVMMDYIVHFAHHLQWPIEVFSGTDAPFRICVMDGELLREPLAARLKHHRIDGRLVAVESVESGPRALARSCQILILGPMERASLIEAVGALEFFPVLTVSDADRFAATGGMVGFAGDGDNVALQLNKTMLDRAELKMGDSLFRLSGQID